jgi:hypothetical protein
METYEFSVENFSLGLPLEEEEKESSLFKEFFRRQAESRNNNGIPSFLLGIPDPFTMRLVINGEIISARNFESHACIYIHHEINIPNCWRIDPKKPDTILSSNTQFSFGSIVPNDDEGYENETKEFRFGHSFELPILTNSYYTL